MKAIILLSGGIDSTLALALAQSQGRECYAVSFNYGQRHRIELRSALAIAKHYKISHKIIKIDPSSFAGSSALVSNDKIPQNRTTNQIENGGIPSTYVPARNTLFLAYALAQAEIIDAQEIYLGANAMDYKAYPDCRPEYHKAFQGMMNLATKQAVEGMAPRLMTPLVQWDKEEIIRQAQALNVPFEKTLSCYNPSARGHHCGSCDACMLRREGFAKASVQDLTKYQ